MLGLLCQIGAPSLDIEAKKKNKKPNTRIERAFVTVDGRERVIAEGQVVAEGRRIEARARGTGDEAEETSDVGCELPEVKYGIKGTGPKSAAITLSVTDECELVVDSIEIGVDVPEQLIASMRAAEGRSGGVQAEQNNDVVKRQTGGWHDHMDVVRLLLTKAYAHIKYRDNGKKVTSAFGQRTWCYNARDGWFGTGSLTDWSETNRTIWIWKRCSFSFIGGSFKHDLDVDVYSWPGNDWEVFCTRRGQTVPLAKFECGKAHKKL